MQQNRFNVVEKKIIARLDDCLDSRLYYHNSKHTLDVIEQAQRIAKEEGINGPDLEILKTAALYHDSGFLFTYNNHELKGCEIVRTELKDYGFNEEELKVICGLIMATKIPQKPHTLLEEILCDADLDYLGRDDYKPISDCLKRELFAFGYIKTDHEWLLMQIHFLESHAYFTRSGKQKRADKKEAVLMELKENLETYKI